MNAGLHANPVKIELAGAAYAGSLVLLALLPWAGGRIYASARRSPEHCQACKQQRLRPAERFPGNSPVRDPMFPGAHLD